MQYVDEFRAAPVMAALRREIAEAAAVLPRPVRLMEVCGSHTMAVARFGIRELLPPNVELLSGPGCPVCVTASGFIDAAAAIAARGAVVSTFGDMLKVPGSDRKNLAECRAAGGRVEVVYSPEQALDFALAHPELEVVFLAIGFETTTAAILATLDGAVERRCGNFSLLCAFKQILPALEFLAQSDLAIDALLLPPHVSSIIGGLAYDEFSARFRVPGVICGFEPVDILAGIAENLRMILHGEAAVKNAYRRAVRPTGNAAAQALKDRFLEPFAAAWRGIGVLPDSGLKLRDVYASFDAARRFAVNPEGGADDPRCRCGAVLTGRLQPSACPVFGRGCTPDRPLGACMVSGEGACAASYKYRGDR